MTTGNVWLDYTVTQHAPPPSYLLVAPLPPSPNIIWVLSRLSHEWFSVVSKLSVLISMKTPKRKTKDEEENENDSIDSINYPQHPSDPSELSGIPQSKHIFLRRPSDSNLHSTQTGNQGTRHLNLVAIRGVHYVEYPVGKPPQKVKLAVNLNSDYTVFRCSPYHDECKEKDCGPHTFNKFQSNSFSQLGCNACLQGDVCVNKRCLIQGDEWTAYRARDTVLTENGLFDLSFGCQVSSGDFLDILEDSANGMIGLSSAPTSFINQQYREGLLESTSFSLCFERYQNRELDNAGTLTIGGYKSDFLTSPMVYIENTGIDGKYTTIITNVYLRKGGGESVVSSESNEQVTKLVFNKDAANSGPGTVIDTGYPGTLLNFRIDEELRSLPTILLQLRTSFAENQFTNPNKVVGMVGDDLDPVSPQDVLLAIPATSYMLKEKNGKYRSMMSLDHEDGSVLGANIFQGRHLLFKTGYSSANSYIGIAEAEMCNEDDGTHGEDFVTSNSPSPFAEITNISTAPSLEGSELKLSRSALDLEGMGLWLLLIGATLLLTTVVIICFFLYCRRRKKRNSSRSADAADDFVSIDEDSDSFVSFGLRSHLFSIMSSKVGSDPVERQSLQRQRSLGSRSRHNRNTSLLDNEPIEPQRVPQVQADKSLPKNKSTNRESSNYDSDRVIPQHPILAEAQPIEATIAQAEPILVIPQASDYGWYQSHNEISKPNTEHGMEYLDGTDSAEMALQPYIGQSTKWSNTQPQGGKSFLVRKGSIESSDDEDGTFGSRRSRHSRKQARRQLELAAGKIAASKACGGNPRARSRDKRQDTRAVENFSMNSRSKLKGSRRQTMPMGYTFENRIDPSTRKSSGSTLNSKIDPMTTTKRASKEMPRNDNTLPFERKLAHSRIYGEEKSSRQRSTKAAAISRGGGGSLQFSNNLTQHHSNQIAADENRRGNQAPNRRSIIGEGALIGVREDTSAISGLTELGKPPMRPSITSDGADWNKSAEFLQKYDNEDFHQTERFQSIEAQQLSPEATPYQFSDLIDKDSRISRHNCDVSKRSSGASRRGSIDSKRSSTIRRSTLSNGTASYQSRRDFTSENSGYDPSLHEYSSSDRQSTDDFDITRDKDSSRYRWSSGESNKSRQQDHSRHSRRSSGESSQSRRGSTSWTRRSMAMKTIKEIPSKKGNFGVHTTSTRKKNRPHNKVSTSRNDVSRASDRQSAGNMPRCRGSLESFARYQLDKEMQNRKLPAAPQYRLMSNTGRNSLW